MALDTDDIVAIRGVFNEAFEVLVLPRFDEIDDRLDKMDDRLDSMDGRLDSMDDRLDSMDGRLDQMDGRLDNIDGRLDRQERTTQELQTEVRAGFAAVNKRLDDLSGKVEALESDIKELYEITVRLEHGTVADRKFAKLSLEKKLLTLNAELLAAAKQAGITLPR